MKAQIIDIIAKAANLDTETVSNLIEIPPKADMGDYAFPCFQFYSSIVTNEYARSQIILQGGSYTYGTDQSV